MTRIVWLVGMLLLFYMTTPLLAQQCDCVSTGNCPVQIEDNGTFQGTLDVTVSGNNDLGDCPLTRVCFSITHTWVGDLSVALTSPAGVNYLLMADVDNGFGGCGNEEDNVDVCIEVGTGNPLTNNTEYICNPGVCVSGNCCLTGNWTAPCGGVSDPVSGAAQAPNCDLNDFNVPGDPANGTWTLTVNDICDQDVGELINFSLEFQCGVTSCIVCEAEGGSLSAPDVASCFGEPDLNLNLPPNYGQGEQQAPLGEYTYDYVISQNETIVAINPTPDMTSQPPGVYEVCGLSYLTLAIGEVQSLIGMDLTAAQNLLMPPTAAFCGDFSNDCITVTIGNIIPPTLIDTFACIGDCIYIDDGNNGTAEVCSSGDVVLESYLGCDSVITVILQPIFVPPVTIDTTLCLGECMEVDNNVYCPPGPFVITLESYLGCDSVVTYFVTEDMTQATILPDPPPVLDCINPSAILDGYTSSPNPVGINYSWLGPNSFLSNDAIIYITEPGVYTLFVENTNVDPSCISSAEVTVEGNLEEPDLQLNGPPPAICNGDAIDLSTLDIDDLNNTSPVLTFHSGTPATPANELPITLVAPNTTTTYYALGTNSGGCIDELAIEVIVNPLPLSNFTLTSPICQDETSTLTYLGNAGTGATFTWTFDGGTATPGTGPGPHSITWPTSGTKTVTLAVTENGCTSILTSQTIEVAQPLPQPVANCNPQTNSIEFIWGSVTGATGYNVNVAIGPLGTITSDTSYLITGLNSGELASIFIEAISGNACDNSMVQISCTAQDCPPITISVDPVPDICLDGTQSTIALSATPIGGNGSGVFTFTGPGVNPISATFNPNNADIGTNNILVTYEEGTCVYNASIIINVFPQPTADFTATQSICLDETSTLTYTGDASSDANYTWDFNGGTATPGAGIGPHEVGWQDGGIYAISLTVEENGCTSEMTTQNVEVDTPLPKPEITCDASTSSIEFFWQQVPNAVDFTVNTISSGSGIMTSDTSILFNNLTPNTVISIEVIANGIGACGSSSTEASCTANNCGDVEIAIQPVDDICLGGTTNSFDLVPTIIGGLGGGDLSWSGDGIVDGTAGTFDPHQGVFGENVVTALYVEGNCTYSQDFSIFIYDLPVASFTADAPVCEGDAMAVSYSGPPIPGLVFNWDFGGATAAPGTGAGPHQVTWPDNGLKMISLTVENANGCVSEAFESEVQIAAPLIPPSISCSSTTSSIEFTWSTVTGATDYTVDVINGPAGVFTPPNIYSFDGLSPNEEVTIELTVTGNGACPPIILEESCIAIDCPSLTLEIIPDGASVCISNSSMIDLDLIGAGVNGTIIWNGNGITDKIEGVFDPTVAGVGSHTITVVYEEGNCSYQSATIIEVFDQPTADFFATPVICMTEEATLNYLGNASLSANYSYDLDSGVLNAAQQTVSWNAPGLYTISLSVEQDGCESDVFTQEVEVTPELAMPDIICTGSDESVEFVWNDVAGATGYDIEVLSGQTGIYTPPDNYLVNNLSSGEEVTIEVTVNGNTICELPIATASCTANDCPNATLELSPIGPLCHTQNDPILLEAIVTGGSGSGIGTWSGPGVVNGEFNPLDAGVGTHTLVYEYMEGINCVFSEELTVKVQEAPMPAISLTPISCYGESDGSIIINSVTGGQAPYLFSLNGSPFSDITTFTQLEPATYEVYVLDANGCENMLTFNMEQPQELNVELVVSIEGDNNVITLGELVTMTGVATVPEDSLEMVQWEPAEIVSCDTCLQTTTEPIQQTTFILTIEDNGCMDSDEVTIYVSKERNVFVPNAFSPNGDNLNDQFMIYADNKQVVKVNSFLVFNRWGETVHQYFDFPPNDPTYGWQGTFKGEKLNPGVFTWFAEIEFTDGVTQMFEGDVILVK